MATLLWGTTVTTAMIAALGSRARRKPRGQRFVSLLAVCSALGIDSVDDFRTGRDLPIARGHPFVFGAPGDPALPKHHLLACGDTCRPCIRCLDFAVAMRL